MPYRKPAQNNNPAPVGTMGPPAPQQQNPGILRKLFGGLSKQYGQEWPELQRSWESRQAEQPELASNVSSIKPMGIWDKYMTSGAGAYAMTGPFGGIRLNQGAISRDNQNIDDILNHEMVHAGQGIFGYLKGKFGTPKMRNEIENEAINKESMRRVIPSIYSGK
jgi:hypothetical protein